MALTGATVLTGENLEPHTGATVLIQNGTIVEVGEDDKVDIPPEATVLNLSGYTLMPGLIDMHVHLGFPKLEPNEEPGILMIPELIFDMVRFIPDTRHAFLDNGVTTVRDVGDDYDWIIDLRQQLRDGDLEGPRLFAAGPVFTTPGGHPVATFGVEPTSDSVRLPATPEEARSAVRLLSSGNSRVDFIKVIQERGSPTRPLEPIPPNILNAIVTEAHNNSLPVTAHWGTLEDLDDVLTAGVDGLEHLESRDLLEGWPREPLALLVERNIPLTPTLVVTEKVISPEIHQKLRQRVGEFHSAGGRVVVGSDAPINGVPFGAGVHRELELLVESGYTPEEALKAATSEASKVLRTDDIGAIETGRAADIVVVNGNPLQDIKDTRNVVMVFRDGRLVVDHRNEK
ncbi:MAG TPA: amidohydrolase family protein [Methanosarcina sp.]|nr:amidohydrolase family protein [Methanosarcina sp.]